MTNPLIVSLFFAVLFGEVLSQSSSAKVLENLKKRYPERRFENIIDGDFRRYLAIARVNGSSAYHIGVVEAGQKFSEIAVEAGIAVG
uniref:Lytic murein transglycosylase n=1 Tax=Bursaphelenchus xylophilus TaxID=6326 RepID=A0A1I7SN38_BURXY